LVQSENPHCLPDGAFKSDANGAQFENDIPEYTKKNLKRKKLWMRGCTGMKIPCPNRQFLRFMKIQAVLPEACIPGN